VVIVLSRARTRGVPQERRAKTITPLHFPKPLISRGFFMLSVQGVTLALLRMQRSFEFRERNALNGWPLVWSCFASMTPGTRRSGVTRSAAAVPGGGVLA
jgi:hypothetical protein